MAVETQVPPTSGALRGAGPWRPFDVRGALPTGTTVLEASAGTGKTFALAALTARFVAEADVPLRSLLLVTFGRMATTELRSRVRERLTSLLAALAGGTPAAGDEVAALLCAVDEAERGRRRARVDAALRDIDEATIATTHEFCLQMLESLGVLGDAEPQAHFVEQVDDLVDEVVSDLYLRRYAPEGRPPFTLPEAQTLGRRACASVTARLVPRPAEESPDLPEGRGGWAADAAAERVSFAEAVRAEVERRMRAARLFTYDDMLTRLAASLHDRDRGPAAVARLRSRYGVVLVDEFQDTDPVQWDILRTAFAGHARMVLIGDPKQAIYGFRGADVQCYLDARETPGTTVSTLPTNYRSDAALVEALGTVLGGASLGERGIVVDPVSAARPGSRLSGPAEQTAPFRLRVWPAEPGEDKPVRVREVRGRVRDDLVADVVRLLGGGPAGHSADNGVRLDRGDGRGPRPVGPGDVAVLVRTNEAAEDVRTRLVGAGVPTVVHAARSVFASEAAQDWVTLLAALDVTRQATVRAATLTAFYGWGVADLVRASEPGEGADDRLVDVTQQLRAWRRLLAARGVAALVETATRENRVAERLLATEGGARRLTDLRHLAEVLHDASVVRQLGPGALLDWLRERVAEARRDKGAEGSRRLESDGSQVTVVTIHRSKGLEYPVVYLPDAYDRWVPDDDGGTLLLHPETDGTGPTPALDLDVGGKRSPGRPSRFRRYQAEQASEDLRLLYVALTRAQCQVVTWWAPTRNTPCSALQRLLRREVGGAHGGGAAPATAYPLTLGDPTHGRDLGPHVRLETFDPGQTPAPGRFVRREGVEGPLGVRSFDRTLDLAWRRTSYSALTAAAHGLDLSAPGVSSEPEPGREDDETPAEGELDAEAERDAGLEAVRSEQAAARGIEPGAPGATDPWDAISPMAGLPSGADFGTAVHAVLEDVDPGAADLAAEVRSLCASVLARSPSSAMTTEALTDGLLPAFLTPLGRLVDDRTLADVPRRDRLAELTFELPLAGGDRPSAGELRLGDLAPLLRRHLPADGPLGTYADRLTAPVLADQPLRGYLTGSIDAVLRVAGSDGVPRYLVVDYKTNWLGPFDGRPLTLRAYAPDALATAMMGAHYPLQALLYAVALHRMLRWRQPGYDPEVHLGGVLYLFVRGMAGPATPRTAAGVAGVFEWRPPAALVTELSDLLAAGGSAR